MDKTVLDEEFRYENGKLYNKRFRGGTAFEGVEAGSIGQEGYRQLNVFNKTYRTHRVIWAMFNKDIPKGMVIHHINNIKDDNRIENLKLVTRMQNRTEADGRGKGYSIKKGSGKFVAQRTINKKKHFLGYFGTPCGAIMATRMAYITI